MAKQIRDNSLLNFAKEVLSGENRPLTSQEIFEIGEQKGIPYTTNVSKDKIPLNIYTGINQHIQKHEDSPFVGIGRRPVRWGLKEKQASYIIIDFEDSVVDEPKNNNDDKDKNERARERDLHPLLVYYVNNDPYFSSCLCKTIHHEQSGREEKGVKKWLHPDIVGVSYPFGDSGSFEDSTLRLMNLLSHSECRLFSFEMKIEVTKSLLRDYYFQAISNSSWANEGYLVAIKYDEEILDELKDLNAAFGIGFIHLNPNSVMESVRLIPARLNKDLDWNMIDKLSRGNEEFRWFINTICQDLNSGKMIKTRNNNDGDFDEIYDDKQVKKQCKIAKSLLEKREKN